MGQACSARRNSRALGHDLAQTLVELDPVEDENRALPRIEHLGQLILIALPELVFLIAELVELAQDAQVIGIRRRGIADGLIEPPSQLHRLHSELAATDAAFSQVYLEPAAVRRIQLHLRARPIEEPGEDLSLELLPLPVVRGFQGLPLLRHLCLCRNAQRPQGEHYDREKSVGHESSSARSRRSSSTDRSLSDAAPEANASSTPRNPGPPGTGAGVCATGASPGVIMKGGASSTLPPINAIAMLAASVIRAPDQYGIRRFAVAASTRASRPTAGVYRRAAMARPSDISARH